MHWSFEITLLELFLQNKRKILDLIYVCHIHVAISLVSGGIMNQFQFMLLDTRFYHALVMLLCNTYTHGLLLVS